MPVCPLDGLVAGGRVVLKPPVLVKIDVQGSEGRVLEGAAASLPAIDAIVVEMSIVPLYEGQPLLPEVRASLEEAGFAYRGAFTEGRSGTTGERIQVDGLFRRS